MTLRVGSPTSVFVVKGGLGIPGFSPFDQKLDESLAVLIGTHSALGVELASDPAVGAGDVDGFVAVGGSELGGRRG
jgi:hypothetical protein